MSITFTGNDDALQATSNSPSLTARKKILIRVSAMGAATSIAVKGGLTSTDSTTQSLGDAITAAGDYLLELAYPYVELVGTGGTDYTATGYLVEAG